jgi:7-cyano-7-deazaguanine synthase
MVGNIPPEYDLLILYSGGADSRLLLELSLSLNYTPMCCIVDYGQKHIEEISYAKNQLDHIGIIYEVIKIENYNVNSGLTGNNTPCLYSGVNEMNVPARNTILIAIAAGIAESRGIEEIWFGADFTDRLNNFPDCFQEYVIKMNELLKISGSRPITLRAPLLGLTKEMVKSMLTNVFDVSLQQVYSGYEKPKEE